MSENVLKYQCPACGGPVHFDPNEQLIVCDYCDSKYPEDHFKDQEDEKKEEPEVDWKKSGFVHEEMEDQIGFICTSCGAEIVSDANTAATECMYCGNPIVLGEKVSGMLKPDLILPFKIDKPEAENLLRKFYDKKFLLPKTFKDQNRISKITGMYVPFWLFSGKGDGEISYKATISRTYRDGKYDCTEFKHFQVFRDGSVCFEKVPVDASKKMEDNYMDGLEPYNYEELKEFSPEFMAGFFADKFDVDVAESSQRARARIIQSTKNAIRGTVTGYSSVTETTSNVDMKDDEVKYALLPVWMLNTKYNGKMYHFAINGQTGKVSGDLPIDKVKRILVTLGITVASYIPLALLAYFLAL